MEPADRRAFAELRQSGLKTESDGGAGGPKAVGCALPEVAWNWTGRFEKIMTLLRHRVTNAARESINSKGISVKYKAREFRNKRDFRVTILFLYVLNGSLAFGLLSQLKCQKSQSDGSNSRKAVPGIRRRWPFYKSLIIRLPEDLSHSCLV
jgi:hypothetical protein